MAPRIQMDYIPNTETDLQSMLDEIGAPSFDDLVASIPASLLVAKLDLPPPLTELELARELNRIAARNTSLDNALSFLGAGAYEHFIPSAIDHLVMRGEFYTAYTPYQAEASQGTLQAIYEYQTMIARLTGMDVSNASLYDGASALAEAALMCLNANPGRNTLALSAGIHPEYRQTVATYLQGYDVKLVEIPCSAASGQTDLDALQEMKDLAGVLMQSPNYFGCIEPMARASEIAHGKASLLVACVNPISLGVLAPPGEYGADIAVGEGQPLGIPVGYGGPWLGFFASTKPLVHKIAGRIVGRTNDTQGTDGFVLTLQAREQHIRREKATSNICTNQSLMALRACVYMSLLGKTGLQEVAALNVVRAHDCAEKIRRLPGFSLKHSAPFFNEFVVACPRPSADIVAALQRDKIFAGVPVGERELLVCVTETKSDADIDRFINALANVESGSR
jgi:glycine dehydrogenase subunit 1